MNAQLLEVARRKFIEDFNGREPLDMGVADGIVWVTVVGPVGVNGYAMIPAEGHPWSGELPCDNEWDLDDVLDIHGGVTWARHPWIGFDTAHAGDWWPPEYDKSGISNLLLAWDQHIRWTPEMVTAEAERLAIQVARIGQDHQPDRFQHLGVAECNTFLLLRGGR